MEKLTRSFEILGVVISVEGMASGNLAEEHIMVKRYCFLDLVFGAYTVNHHFVKWLLKGWNGFNGNLFPNMWQMSKSCKILPRSARFEANKIVYLAVGFIDA